MASFLSQIAKITDNLYLSSFVGASEPNLNKLNINCVITVCREVPKVEVKNVESIKLDVMDKPNESLARYFDYIADKIHDVSSKNGACLVHCVAGISRSATMVIAYLMKHLKMTLKDAHSLVKTKRPFIRPNLGFWRQLVDYEHSLFGYNTIKIVPSNIGYIPDIYENEVKNMQPWIPAPMAKPGAPNQNQNAQVNALNLNTPNGNNTNRRYQPNNNYNTSTLQPIIGNAIPKFARNGALEMSESGGVDVAKLANKSHYTTTYRSSYQKP